MLSAAGFYFQFKWYSSISFAISNISAMWVTMVTAAQDASHRLGGKQRQLKPSAFYLSLQPFAVDAFWHQMAKALSSEHADDISQRLRNILGFNYKPGSHFLLSYYFSSSPGPSNFFPTMASH